MLFTQQSFAIGYSPISYVDAIPEESKIVDVRVESECRKSTLAKANCLPIEELMASKQRLANFSGLLWKLGTVGLNGSEHVLVIGNKMTRKDTMAGILHLAGQYRISILKPSMTELIDSKSKWSFSKGTLAPPTRIQVWQTLMRSDNIVLHNEMMQLVLHNNPTILDGRSDEEYWGQVVNAHRGGHIPGADSSSYSYWFDAAGSMKTAVPLDSISTDHPVIAYAANSYASIGYYARLIAAGLTPRVYLDGWVRWASQSDLPVDAGSYGSSNALPTVPTANKAESTERQHFPRQPVSWLFWGLSVAIAFLSGYIISRIRQRKN